MIKTLQQKLLCMGCAALLAAALVPVGAWGADTDNGEPGGNTEISDISDTPAEDTDTSNAPSSEDPVKETNGEDEGAGEDSDNSGGDDSEDTKSSEGATRTGTEYDDENTTAGNTSAHNTGDAATTSEAEQFSTPPASPSKSDDTVSISLSPSEVTIQGYSCPCCAETHGTSEQVVNFTITVPENSNASDYEIELVDSAGSTISGSESQNREGTSGYFSLHGLSAGTYTAKVVSSSSSNELAGASLKVTVSDTEGSLIFGSPSERLATVGSTIDVFASEADEISGGLFSYNEAWHAIFSNHRPSDYIGSVTSSDSSIVSIGEKSYPDGKGVAYWEAHCLKAGTVTVNVTTIDGRNLETQITVVDSLSLDPDQLSFMSEHDTINPGEIISFVDFSDRYVSTGEQNPYPGRPWAFISKNQDVVKTVFTCADEIDDLTLNVLSIRALKPGEATIELYYFDVDDWSTQLVDTMTLIVQNAQPNVISRTTAASDIPGYLISTTNDTDTLITENKLSLQSRITSIEALTPEQQKGLSVYTNGSNTVIPIDFCLVKPTGEVFEVDGENSYSFILRLSLEDNLAQIDPASISVCYISDDGAIEDIPSWVQDGYLYINTTHFSQYAIVGQKTAEAGDNQEGASTNAEGTSNSNQSNLSQVSNETSATGDTSKKASTSTANKKAGATSTDTSLAQTSDGNASAPPLAVAAALAALSVCLLSYRRCDRQR